MHLYHFLSSPYADSLRIEVHEFPLPLPTPLPNEGLSQNGMRALVLHHCSFQTFLSEGKFTWISLPAGSWTSWCLDLPGGPSSRDTKAALPTAGSKTFWSAHMHQLPEHFTGLMKVGRGTECKRPKPQAWGGSVWKKEGELQLSSSIIHRLRGPGGHPAGRLSGRRTPATSVLHLHGSQRHSICPQMLPVGQQVTSTQNRTAEC